MIHYGPIPTLDGILIADANAPFLRTPDLLLPGGEECKTRAWKEYIEDFLDERACGPETTLIAYGGGSILDLVGFTAATWCRGINFLSVPTTLLAMVDACYGGKTAINSARGKNRIGAFWPAKEIYIDPLLPMPDWLIEEGRSEMIKHALIASPTLFDKLEAGEPHHTLIEENLAIKKHLCETNRDLLNFGHTVAHAIESLTDYEISHGHAVGLGLLAEAHACGMPQLERLLAMTRWAMPQLSVEALLDQMRYDKKAKNGIPHISTHEGLRPIDLRESLTWLLESVS